MRATVSRSPSRIEDVLSKRNGALVFIVRETDVDNQDGVRVAEVRSTIIVKGAAVSLNYDSINVGDTLPPLELPPLSRATLALYAGASGDHNPMHIDLDFRSRRRPARRVRARDAVHGVARPPAHELGSAARPARVQRALLGDHLTWASASSATAA
jgi:hypothetical protein